MSIPYFLKYLQFVLVILDKGQNFETFVPSCSTHNRQWEIPKSFIWAKLADLYFHNHNSMVQKYLTIHKPQVQWDKITYLLGLIKPTVITYHAEIIWEIFANVLLEPEICLPAASICIPQLWFWAKDELLLLSNHRKESGFSISESTNNCQWYVSWDDWDQNSYL